MLNLSDEAILVTKRFFYVLDILIAQKKINSLNAFANEYNINYWNLYTLKKEPERRLLKIDFIIYLVQDYNVSPMYLLTGVGSIFKKN